MNLFNVFRMVLRVFGLENFFFFSFFLIFFSFFLIFFLSRCASYDFWQVSWVSSLAHTLDNECMSSEAFACLSWDLWLAPHPSTSFGAIQNLLASLK